MSLDLHIGRKKTGISIRPDSRWPQMWRVHQDGRVSDMVNLARAKDAGLSWALVGRDGGFGDKIPNWQPSETPAEGRYGGIKPLEATKPLEAA